MRYRKENGQWKEVTPLGVSREEFDEVKQDLTHKIEDSVEWKYVGSVGGAEYISIPSGAREICVRTFNTVGSDTMINVIPTASLSSSFRYLVHGSYYTPNEYVFCNLNAYSDRIAIRTYLRNGTDIKSTATLYLYYR